MSTTQNETQGIAQTIRTAMNTNGAGGYYDTYARPVVVALTTRETELSEKLVDYAVDAGADGAEVKAYLREIGMAVATDPESEDPESEDVESEDEDATTTRIASALERIEQRIESLTDFARRNGYRG